MYFLFICLMFSLTLSYPRTVMCINVFYVDWDIDTPIAVNCDKYKDSFTNQIRCVCIKDTTVIDSLLSELKKLPPSDLKEYPAFIDTRVKISIVYTDSVTEEICADGIQVMKDNHLYLLSNNLKKIIDRCKKK